MDKKNSKNKIIITVIIVLIIASIFLILFISENDKDVNIYNDINKNEVKEPIVKESEETEVSSSLKNKIIKWLPYVYIEAQAPFETDQILNITLDKILENNFEENLDLSEKTVDKKVKEIFGNDVSIDTLKVSTPDTSRSIYYYNNETNSYEVIPMGFSGVFKHQIVKEITKKDNMIYVYTYVLIGTYSYDEDLTGDVTKVYLTIGDKDGLDLNVTFNSVNEMNDNSYWISKYANKLPIFRYTIKNINNGFVLEEVEQIGY